MADEKNNTDEQNDSARTDRSNQIEKNAEDRAKAQAEERTPEEEEQES